MRNKIVTLLVIYIAIFWFFPKTIFAVDSGLVINEIMYDWPDADSETIEKDGQKITISHEWVEVKNIGSREITFTGKTTAKNWKFYDGSNHYLYFYPELAVDQSIIIRPGEFVVLADDPATFLIDYPKFSGTLFKVSMSLNNDGDTLKLSQDSGASWFFEVSYLKNQGASGDGKSLEYDATIGGATSDNWRGSYVMGGTPGRENSTLADLPKYSQDVYINEIFPYPSNGSDNEFIELYNSGGSAVDLSGWELDDVIGKGARAYEIKQGTIIAPDSFLVFYKPKTKLTLNDKGDEVNLINPAGERVYSIPYPSAKKDETYMRTEEGFWRWSVSPTSGAKNILRSPITEDFSSRFEDLRAIPVKTGEISDYEGKRAEIIGSVVETSGATFYLDDGSGKVKVYIQTKTKIKKPRMQKGYEVKIVGIVNLYRGIWRVLPQYQEDIEIITINAKAKKQSTEQKEKLVLAKENVNISTGIDQAYAKSDAEALLEDIVNNPGVVKSAKTSNLFNKTMVFIIIVAMALLLILTGEWLWKKRLSQSLAKKPGNSPTPSPKDSEAGKL